MEITNRQKLILEIVIKDYIDLVEPISSNHIEKRYNLLVSPATIRNDLKDLTEKGYLIQPHTSAGRIPSDKAYRYFVNKLLEKKKPTTKNWENKLKKIELKSRDEVSFLRELTAFLAGISSVLTYSYLEKENMFWREGFEETLHYPEFENIEKVHSFFYLLKEFEKRFEKRFYQNLQSNEIKIYIGKEGHFKNEDFSILISKHSFSGRDTYVAFLGPKRMSYDKNIRLINSLINLLEKNDQRDQK